MELIGLVVAVVVGTMGGMFMVAIAADRLMTRIGRWLAMEEEEEYDADYDDLMDGAIGG